MKADRKALIAMSGGVDSSVAAFLTLQQGYSCLGATMELYQKPDEIADARLVAQQLDIPFHVFRAQAPFQEYVLKPFVQCYEAGLTPNPCVECNRYIKFGHLLDCARELGCEYIATGHYAQIQHDSSTERWLLKKAVNASKDQSYFLATLTQEQLAHILFPLGRLTKEQVRQIAQEQNLLNAKKRDSQDICFIPDGDYMAFLERYTGKQYPCGDFLDQNGQVVGHHRGAVGYTLGQRKGLGIALGQPVYVCGKDMERNTVTVGANEALFSTGLLADNWSWFPFPTLTEPIRIRAKTRSRQTEQPATVYPEENGTARVIFDEPQRAITPGQTVALYEGDTVIGGGRIIHVL